LAEGRNRAKEEMGFGGEASETEQRWSTLKERLRSQHISVVHSPAARGMIVAQKYKDESCTHIRKEKRGRRAWSALDPRMVKPRKLGL